MIQAKLILPVLAILLVVILVAFGPLRGWRRFTGSPPPQPWHPVVRVACGLLAIVLLGAVAAASWKATAPHVTDDTLFLLAPPTGGESAEATGESRAPSQKPSRVIYTVLAASVSHGELIPIDGKSVVFDLRERRRGTGRQTIKGRLPGGTFTSEVAIDSLEERDRNRLAVRGHEDIEYSTGSGTGWHGGGLPDVGQIQIDRVSQWGSSRERDPLSILPDQVSDTIVILSHIAAIVADEPRTLSAKDWLDEQQPNLRTTGDEFRPSYRPQPQANGIAMLAYTGPASALLLLAAILASQCFRHRGMAFAGSLVVAVLFAIAMDRIMVERHASWLVDHPTESVQREAVVARMQHSFFHAGRVEAILAARQP
jgi:hypothetical protein